MIKLPAADNDTTAYDVTAILDPATRAAQKYTPIILVLQSVANVNVRVFLNAREQLSELPLKRLVGLLVWLLNRLIHK